MFALLTRVVSKIATVFHNSNYPIARGFNLSPVSTRFLSFSLLLFKPVTSCYYFCSASEFIRKLDKLYRDINTTAALTEDSFPGVKINVSLAFINGFMPGTASNSAKNRSGWCLTSHSTPAARAFAAACFVCLFGVWQFSWSREDNVWDHGLRNTNGKIG